MDCDEVLHVFNQLPSNYVLIVRDFSFVFANNNFLKIIGQYGQQFKKCKVDEATFLQPPERERFCEAVKSARNKDAIDNIVFKFCNPTTSQLFSVCGSVTDLGSFGVTCTFQLLSEKYSANDTTTILEKDTSQNQFIIHHLSPKNISFEDHDLQTRLQAACELLGLDQNKVENFEFSTFGKTLSLTCRCVGQTSSGGALYSVSYEDITKTTELSSLLKSATNQLQDLQLQMKLFNKFFEVAPTHMGLLEVVEDKRDIAIVYSNPAASHALKRTPEECKGLTSSAVGVPQEQIDESIEFCKIAKTTGNPYYYERTFTRVDLPPVTLTTWLMHVEDNKFAFLSQDVSQYHRLQEELQKHQQELEQTVAARTQQLAEAVQVKSRFLANMSHEIRTPLSGILGMISLLSESPLTTEQEALLHTAEICSEQLLAVINDVLDLTRMEENKLNLEQKLFSLPTLLEDSLEVVAFEAHKKNLDLISDLDPSLPDWVIGDPTRLRQILVNLLGNAVKFSFMGEIVLSARLQSSTEDSFRILCSVQDQGIGIPESSKKAIFQPFSQADSSVTRKFGGSGLGLNIAKHLVHLMGGEIGFVSQEGVGSTFSFEIGMRKANAQDFALTPTTNDFTRIRSHELEIRRKSMDFHSPIEGNFKALVADSSAKFCDSMKKTLMAWKISVDTATTAEQALQYASHCSEYNIVLLDSRFGNEVAQALAAVKSPRCYMGIIVSQGNILSNYGFTLKRPVRRSLIRKVLVELSTTDRSVDATFGTSKKRPLEENISLPPVSILIAEDNIANQFTLKKLLENFGLVNVLIVDNGKKAVEALKTRSFDIILMDVMMPEMGGLETTEVIRKEFSSDKQPYIIAQSANAFSEDLSKCMAAGMNDYITKPINRKSLLAALHKAVNFKKIRTE